MENKDIVVNKFELFELCSVLNLFKWNKAA